jgi:hypothetical protein
MQYISLFYLLRRTISLIVEVQTVVFTSALVENNKLITNDRYIY